MTADHIRDPAASNIQVTLKKLSKLKNVNALEEGQVLSFGKTGLTIIYGNNGAGKSGYARVLKQACRARRPDDEMILPNVYENQGGTPQAEIAFCVAGQSQTFTWQQGKKADPRLSAISFFDSKTANVHVDEKNQLAYMPVPLKILKSLADVCQKLKKKLDDEIKTLQDKTPEMIKKPKCKPNTEVGKLLKDLSAKTNLQKVENLSGLCESEENELQSLKKDFMSDPSEVVQILEQYKTKIEHFKCKVKNLETIVQQPKINELIKLKLALDNATKTANLDASELFSCEPLPNVGSDIWRELWKAARQYSEEKAYPEQDFPVTEKNAKCVLCHQELNSEAAKRLIRFEEFVCSKIKQQQEEAEQVYREQLKQLSDQQISMKEMVEIVTFIRKNFEDKAIAERVRKCAVQNAWRLRSILNKHAGRPEHQWPQADKLAWDEISEVLEWLSNRISGLKADMNSLEKQKMITRHDELDAREWLGGVKGDVLAEIERKRKISEIEKYKKTTTTNRITTLSTDLAKTLVTDHLSVKFAQEIDNLGVSELKIELKQAQSSHGVSFFHIKLTDKLNGIGKIGKILSEGEHRCVALAGFLAELATTNSDSAIVFDDPVSSLDHVHRKKVAERLVYESCSRQVIVFTHDIAFFVFIEESRRTTETPNDIHHRLVSRSISNAVGFCQNEMPDYLLSVEKQVKSMRKRLENVKIHYERDDQAKWGKEVEWLYGELRKSWEGAVEKAVSPVLKRLSQKVNTIGLIKLTILNEKDYGTMREAYGRCSKHVHSQPVELAPNLPTPNEIEEEINELDDWVQNVQKRQNKVVQK